MVRKEVILLENINKKMFAKNTNKTYMFYYNVIDGHDYLHERGNESGDYWKN